MAYKKRFTPYAHGLLRRLSPQAKLPLRLITDKLIVAPYSGKALRDDLIGFYSIRHNRYRIIYEIDETRKTIIVHHLGLRESVYEEFSQLVKAMKRRQ